jgi:hypothetical protein
MRPDVKSDVQPRSRHRRVTGTAILAVLEERLHNLEAEVADVKGRVNNLIFLIVGTVVAQVILRLVE